MKLSAVLVAAGSSRRMQSAVRNKLLADLNGRPVLAYTIEAFTSCAAIDELVIVTSDHKIEAELGTAAPEAVFVPGGKTRKESSEQGVLAATGDHVLIHDGARPFPSQALIHRVIDAMHAHGAAIPVLRMHDALHLADDAFLHAPEGPSTPSACVRAQTPQGFRREQLLECLGDSPDTLRDDAAAFLRHNLPVAVVAGDPLNLKITTPEDLALATAIATLRKQDV